MHSKNDVKKLKRSTANSGVTKNTPGSSDSVEGLTELNNVIILMVMVYHDKKVQINSSIRKR
jgi:hypothetical protein